MVTSFPSLKCLLAALLLGVLAGSWLSGCSAPSSPKQEQAESWDEGLPARSRNASAPRASRPSRSAAPRRLVISTCGSADAPRNPRELAPPTPKRPTVDSADSAADGTPREQAATSASSESLYPRPSTNRRTLPSNRVTGRSGGALRIATTRRRPSTSRPPGRSGSSTGHPANGFPTTHGTSSGSRVWGARPTAIRW